MQLTGVHGIYKAIKAAESIPHYRRIAAEIRASEQARAEMIARRTPMPSEIPAKILNLATDESMAEECRMTGVSIMKRIHCLKYQAGSVNQPAQRNVVTEDSQQFGFRFRFKKCVECRHWLTADEWKIVRQILAASGGWDEFQKAVVNAPREKTAATDRPTKASRARAQEAA